MNRLICRQAFASDGMTSVYELSGCTALTLSIGSGTGVATVQVTNTPDIPASWSSMCALSGVGSISRPVYHQYMRVSVTGSADVAVSGGTYDVAAPAWRHVPATKADADMADGVCRALLVGAAGTANLMDAAGNIRANVPLQAGYNPLSCRQVRTGGTASDIWALY